jgi:two-component system, OmpR family, sensor histidine kinase BaeS
MTDPERGAPTARGRGRGRRADGGRGWWDPEVSPGAGPPPWSGHGPPWAGPDWAGPPRRWFLRRFAGLALGLLLFVVLLAAVGGFVFASVFGLLGPDRPGHGGFLVVARLIGVALLLGGIVVVVARVRTIATPIDELVDATRRVTAGDYSVRVDRPHRGPRELRELAAGFNTMTARLETNEDQRRSLLADVSHELRTPLAVVRGNIEAIVDGVHPADPEHLSAILDETLVLGRLVEDLRTVALSEAGTLPLHREPTDLGLVIDEAARAFETMATTAGVGIVVREGAAHEPGGGQDPPLLDIDPVRIREVVDNLVANALRYTPSGGTVTISTTLSPGIPFLVVEVADTGAGIAPEVADHLFDRFAKSGESRGSGLGLAIARHLVEAHGGTIEASSGPDRGTTIRFTLPIDGGGVS